MTEGADKDDFGLQCFCYGYGPVTLGLLALALLVGAALLAIALLLSENGFGAVIGGAICVAVAVGYGTTFVVHMVGGRHFGLLDLIIWSAQVSIVVLVITVCLFIVWRVLRHRGPTHDK